LLIADTKIEYVKSQCQGILAHVGTKVPGSSLEDGTRALVEAMKAGEEGPVLRVLGELTFKQTSRGRMATLVKRLEVVPPADRQVPLYSALLGGLYDALGRQKDALSLIEPVLPKIASFNLLDCLKRIAIDQRDGALDLAVCGQLVKTRPGDWQSLNDLAVAYYLTGQKDKCCDIARSLAKRFRDDPDAVRTAGDTLMGGGSYKEAEALLNQSIKKADELAALGAPSNRNIRRDVWSSLRELYRRTGNKAKEIEYIRKLLTVPNNEQNLPYFNRRLRELGAGDAVAGG
jgi:tetratricopeptide (TPR) repeat protein